MKVYIAHGAATDGSGGFKYSDAEYLLDAVNSVLLDASLSTFLSEYLNKLNVDGLYLIGDNLGDTKRDSNAFYLGNYSLDQYAVTGTLVSGYQFYAINADGSLSDSDLIVAPSPGNFQTLNIGSITVKMAVNGGSVASAANPSGGGFGLSLSRIVFHELAHGLTDYNSLADAAFGSDDLGEAGSSLHYAGVEALAIAAENYIYAKQRHQPSRIGHGSYSAGMGIERSFDPALPFQNVGAVAYQQLSSRDIAIGDFYGHVNGANVLLHKKYYQADATFQLTGSNGM